MIERVEGVIVERAPTHVVVGVGGIGYGLSISLNTFEQLPDLGSEVSLLTHTYVREDRLQLFGFSDAEEREMFQLLIAVAGIGPNSAQTILSGMSVDELKTAIFEERASDLTRVRGIGRKTADRVVIDLRDKIAPSRKQTLDPEGEPVKSTRNEKTEEAVLALAALGIAPAAARKAVVNAMEKSGVDATLQ
ncbi:MAG: Holliday junction branch migration protein RuvA, partial [Opitutae bacterium]|nr:Holliday junction branch migration protein RuvA [Opitutae bacterium]